MTRWPGGYSANNAAGGKVDLAFSRQKQSKGDHYQYTECCESWKVLWQKESDTLAEGKWQFELCMQSIHTHGKKQWHYLEAQNMEDLHCQWILWFPSKPGMGSSQLKCTTSQKQYGLLQYLARVRATQMFVVTVFTNVQIMAGFNKWWYITLKYMHNGTWNCWAERSFTSHSAKKLLTGQPSTTNRNWYLKETSPLPSLVLTLLLLYAG